MPLYLVSVDEYDYDEYDAFVVRARTEEDALTLAFEASHRQQEFLHPTITEVAPNGPDEVILGSFNAG